MPVDRRLALHEAGHAVVAFHLGLGIKEIVMCRNPAYVALADIPDEMIWQYLVFLLAGNAAEHKINPKTGWYYTSDFDYQGVSKILNERTASWHPPGLAYDDDDYIEKTEDYIQSYTAPVFNQLEQQAARIINIPEIWSQIEALADVLMCVDRLDGKNVNRLLKAGKPGADSD